MTTLSLSQNRGNHLLVRSRILFLSQCLPFPPHSGVTRRTYHILKELQREFDVTLVAFARRVHQADAASVVRAAEALRREISDVTNPVRINSDYSLARKLRNHAWSVLSREPYIFHEYGDARFGQELQQAVLRARPHPLPYRSCAPAMRPHATAWRTRLTPTAPK